MLKENRLLGTDPPEFLSISSTVSSNLKSIVPPNSIFCSVNGKAPLEYSANENEAAVHIHSSQGTHPSIDHTQDYPEAGTHTHTLDNMNNVNSMGARKEIGLYQSTCGTYSGKSLGKDLSSPI